MSRRPSNSPVRRAPPVRRGLTRLRAGAAVLAAASLFACTPEPPAGTAAAPAAEEAPRPPVVRLPVSINEVMVAMVDHASEPLWIDAYQPPTTEAGWIEAEHHAFQMMVNAVVIQLAGTGPNDEDWVVDPQWKGFARDMGEAGKDALAAARSRDPALLQLAGDDLVKSCESCHQAFKPDLPTMGQYKSSSYPPRE